MQSNPRNAICPKCHRKIKKCTCKAFPWWPVLIAVTMALILLLGGIVNHRALGNMLTDWWYGGEVKAWSDLSMAYLDRHNQAERRWDVQDIDVLGQKIGDLEKHLVVALAKISSANTLAATIAKTFPMIVGTTVIDGQLIRPRSLPLVDYRELHTHGLVIGFRSVGEMMAQGTPAMMYFDKDGTPPSVVAAQIDWPTKVFVAGMVHEMGHALYYRQGHASSTALPGSRLYSLEEVEMHALEAELLNVETDGQFFAIVDASLERIGQRCNYGSILTALTTNDLHRLDVLIEATDASQSVAGMLMSQYEMTVAYRCFGTNRQRLAAFYEFVTRHARLE